ncbi:MAG: hypothetical protein GY841_13580 [FCB group bacterium]|nr:hypothetical protein [FCB group bacterium]
MECRQKETFINLVNLMPSVEDLQVSRDMDNAIQFLYLDGNSDVVDISLDATKITVKDEHAGTTKLQYSFAAGEHEDGENGVDEINITTAEINAAVTPADDSKKWVYEIRRIRPSGQEYVHLTGNFIIQPAVGR